MAHEQDGHEHYGHHEHHAHRPSRASRELPRAGQTYTCPMHPEVVEDAPSDCPICGMALEPRGVPLEAEEESAELRDMQRRFWVSVVFTVPVFVLGMGHLFDLERIVEERTSNWIQLVFATPVVLYGSWPFFVRGWRSLLTRHLNMFTLIALGVGVAYAYSVVATVAPGIFPDAFRSASGSVAVYFEAAAMIVTLVLLGQVLELRARSRTGAAIQALLGLAPKHARRLNEDGSEP